MRTKLPRETIVGDMILYKEREREWGFHAFIPQPQLRSNAPWKVMLRYSCYHHHPSTHVQIYYDHRASQAAASRLRARGDVHSFDTHTHMYIQGVLHPHDEIILFSNVHIYVCVIKKKKKKVLKVQHVVPMRQETREEVYVKV
jgi:hypothetical protein